MVNARIIIITIIILMRIAAATFQTHKQNSYNSMPPMIFPKVYTRLTSIITTSRKTHSCPSAYRHR